MSSFDQSYRSGSHAPRIVAAFLALLTLAGCQVTPLHGTTSGTVGAIDTLSPALGSIAVEPVDDRVEQQVRNELIFLLNGGAGEPVSPTYTVSLLLDDELRDLLRDSLDGRATGQSVRVSGVYQLKDARTGEIVVAQRVQAMANFDRFDQSFADTRALRNAEDRAAREIAERIRADISLILADKAASGSNQGT